jgi:hypothetical protein
MSKINKACLVEVSELWGRGQTRDAGRLIFENLPLEIRPRWAYNILRLVTTQTGINPPPIENILQIASHPDEWNKAHSAFRLIRESVLELNKKKERTAAEMLLLRHLALASIVAKVTYNSSKALTPPYPYPFDEDAGWWMAECVRHILDLLGDVEFSKLMWLALCNDIPKTGGVSDGNG